MSCRGLGLWEEQQIGVAAQCIAGPEIGDNRPVAVVVGLTDEARRVVRVANSAIMRQLRVHAHRPSKGDAVCGRVVDEFCADDARGRDTVLYPLPQRQENIVVGILRTAEIVRAVEDIGAGATTTMSNAGGQEQPSKPLRVLDGLWARAGSADDRGVV